MNISTRVFHVVDGYDFSKAVQEFFGVTGYHFAAEQEAADDVSYDFKADPFINMDEYESKVFDDWKSGEDTYAPGPEILLSLMAFAGVIPAGEYLIQNNV